MRAEELKRSAPQRTHADDNWRLALRRHAEAVWRAADDDSAAGSAARVLSRELGPFGGQALKVAEAFAHGARAMDGAMPPAEFDRGLSILVAGIEAVVRSQAPAIEPASERPPIFQSELFLFLHKVRESAELSYARELDLIELDRRIVFLLRHAGPLVPAGVASAVGVDKAQVSRSVKRLLELKMVERAQIRSPLRLTRKGEALGARLSWLAGLRNRELTFDVGDEELTEFFAAIELLLDRAVSLYEQERDLAQQAHGKGAATERAGKADERKAGEKIVIDRTRIVSPLLTLSSYFSRSGALAFKRLTGLSNFEAWVLSEISLSPPIGWSQLVHALQRDHSQAGRTVTALIERGLVQREGRAGRRHGLFGPTEEGQRLNRIIQEEGRRRNAFLLAPLSEDQRVRFMATFDKIRRNAVSQLERERALEEIERTTA